MTFSAGATARSHFLYLDKVRRIFGVGQPKFDVFLRHYLFTPGTSVCPSLAFPDSAIMNWLKLGVKFNPFHFIIPMAFFPFSSLTLLHLSILYDHYLSQYTSPSILFIPVCHGSIYSSLGFGLALSHRIP